MKLHDEMMQSDPVHAAAYRLQLSAERERDWETAAVAVRVMNARNPFTFGDAVAAAFAVTPRLPA